MFLMNVPPVAVTPCTKWRTCGTPGGYSLPLCLNDSDSDLSTRGTPISDKVQMIIESLRSTQSSEMGDEKDRKLEIGKSGQEGHPQVCKVAMGSFVGANSKAQQISPSTICNESHDSDSDDSVDRGIEEAILEYLKEKDGPKQKSETGSDDFQPSKIPRSPSPIPGISQLNSDNFTFLTPSKELPKSVIIAKPNTPTIYPIKKYIKHKASITETSSTKQDSNKPPSKINDLPIGQTNRPPKYLSDLIKMRKNPEEGTDSSSDDGIEEAIQKYQIEKNQQYKTETQNLHTLSEDSDSTSDDGIEEAIRRYQIEQLKKKSILKPLLNKAKTPVSKCTTKGHLAPTTGTIKKHKLKKKRNKMKKEVLSVSMPSNTLLDCTKGNVLQSFKVEGFMGQSTPPKTNTTTAELMCAEAILDISKTVMPGAFQQTPSLSNTFAVGPCARSSLPNIKLEDESNDSSIDSEDGIEQEIRRFLEQKAQMQKQTLGSAAAPVAAPETSKNEGETEKMKDANKPVRLSLTKKRKQKAEKLNFCTMSALSNVKGTLSLVDSNDESTPPTSPVSKLQKKEPSGDKSSSLDSDEDLDLAIKDLLKTKKKLKKKTRDLKRKPEKCIRKELQASVSLSKKSKLDPPKQSSLKQSGKTNYELSYSTLPKDNISQICNTSQEYVMIAESESYKGTDLTISTLTKPIKDEDSSVDSDDSIELEIRKFLAEKAKVATAEHNKNKTISTNGISPVCAEIQAEDVKPENQRAEIPSKNILLPGQSTENSQLEEKLLFLSPQHLTLRNPPTGAQSLSPSSPTCSQSLLEPADGAGAATDVPRMSKICSGNIQGTSPSKGQSVLNSNLTASQSASIKWRQSLGLPITDTKIRTPFQVTSSKMNETSSTRRPYQSVQNFKVQNPVWSSAKTITASFPHNTETGFHPHALSLLSSARQLPGPFTQTLASGRSSQFPIEEETKSMVHISKDKSVYVELETNRTNHVQVRSRDRSEGKECQDLLTANNSERKSGKMEEKVCPDIKEENFIDEADYESGNKSKQEKKQGLSTLSLSSAIDPGLTFKPCIALTTEERSERFSRRCMDNKYAKEKRCYKSAIIKMFTPKCFKYCQYCSYTVKVQFV